MSDRIRLAEWQGWKRCDPDSEYFFPPNGARPSGPETYHILGLPQPDKYERDCHELIKHLNGLGWIVRISIGPDAADVWIETLANECHDWSGDNWMHGVCELALKVIEQKLVADHAWNRDDIVEDALIKIGSKETIDD